MCIAQYDCCPQALNFRFPVVIVTVVIVVVVIVVVVIIIIIIINCHRKDIQILLFKKYMFCFYGCFGHLT